MLLATYYIVSHKTILEKGFFLFFCCDLDKSFVVTTKKHRKGISFGKKMFSFLFNTKVIVCGNTENTCTPSKTKKKYYVEYICKREKCRLNSCLNDNSDANNRQLCVNMIQLNVADEGNWQCLVNVSAAQTNNQTNG